MTGCKARHQIVVSDAKFGLREDDNHIVCGSVLKNTMVHVGVTPEEALCGSCASMEVHMKLTRLRDARIRVVYVTIPSKPRKFKNSRINEFGL